MTPGEIANLLDERFRLLTGGRRTAVERHQTLRRTVDWSYSLLDEPERMVFDRLGVFAGTFDSAAATAIAAGEGVEAWDVVDALAGLVAKSMVIADESGVETTRYHVLETLRQYARERLEEHGGTDPWRRRHAEYYAAFAEEMAPGLAGPEDWAWRRRVRTELDNLRSAVTWALDSGDDARRGVRAPHHRRTRQRGQPRPCRGDRRVGRARARRGRGRDAGAAQRGVRGRGHEGVHARRSRSRSQPLRGRAARRAPRGPARA